VSLSVCVIGAGSSGIAAVKALAQRGIAFDCFETSDRRWRRTSTPTSTTSACARTSRSGPGVERAERADDHWRVVLDTGETRDYRALLVANGHHWDPKEPEPAFPGTEAFAGVQMHSHHYLGRERKRGARRGPR
jgi:cation diffusion facilitator CzcD-associated flavoprotein CzcO